MDKNTLKILYVLIILTIIDAKIFANGSEKILFETSNCVEFTTRISSNISYNIDAEVSNFLVLFQNNLFGNISSYFFPRTNLHFPNSKNLQVLFPVPGKVLKI